jgi:replicative superfamily II helicase
LSSIEKLASAINSLDSRLAMELAIEVSDMPDILKRYELTPDDLRRKLENPQFRQMIKEARVTWQSDLSVKERIRVKSMVLVEDSLLELYSIFHNQELAAPARIDAFKTLSRVATTDAPDKDSAAAGERVHISINIPGAERPVVYDAEVPDHGREAITHGA